MELLNAATQFAATNKLKAIDALCTNRLPSWMRNAYLAGLNEVINPALARTYYATAVNCYTYDKRTSAIAVESEAR